MANVGGDPGQMTGGAATLSEAGGALRSTGATITEAGNRAAGGTGHGELDAAVRRLAAALGAATEGTGVQAELAAQLAAVAADDLVRATGGN